MSFPLKMNFQKCWNFFIAIMLFYIVFEKRKYYRDLTLPRLDDAVVEQSRISPKFGLDSFPSQLGQ